MGGREQRIDGSRCMLGGCMLLRKSLDILREKIWRGGGGGVAAGDKKKQKIMENFTGAGKT